MPSNANYLTYALKPLYWFLPATNTTTVSQKPVTELNRTPQVKTTYPQGVETPDLDSQARIHQLQKLVVQDEAAMLPPVQLGDDAPVAAQTKTEALNEAFRTVKDGIRETVCKPTSVMPTGGFMTSGEKFMPIEREPVDMTLPTSNNSTGIFSRGKQHGSWVEYLQDEFTRMANKILHGEANPELYDEKAERRQQAQSRRLKNFIH